MSGSDKMVDRQDVTFNVLVNVASLNGIGA